MRHDVGSALGGPFGLAWRHCEARCNVSALEIPSGYSGSVVRHDLRSALGGPFG